MGVERDELSASASVRLEGSGTALQPAPIAFAEWRGSMRVGGESAGVLGKAREMGAGGRTEPEWKEHVACTELQLMGDSKPEQQARGPYGGGDERARPLLAEKGGRRGQHEWQQAMVPHKVLGRADLQGGGGSTVRWRRVDSGAGGALA